MSNEPRPTELHDPLLFRAKALQFRNNPLEGTTGLRMRPRTILLIAGANLAAIGILALVALMPVTIVVQRGELPRSAEAGKLHASPPAAGPAGLAHASTRSAGPDCAAAGATTAPATRPRSPDKSATRACPEFVTIHFRHLYLALLR